MNAMPSARTSSRRTRYENQAEQLLRRCSTDAYQMMQTFAQQSGSFRALKKQITDDHFINQPLNPAYCARALELLVERVIETMQEDLQSAA